MKKFIAKIVGIATAFAMAIGVGVVVNNKEAKPVDADSPATLTFTAACGGSGTDSDGNSWTVTSDANESNFDSVRGIHYGTNSASVTYITLTTNDISGTITQVVVNASDARGSATASVTVGTTSFTCSGSATVTNSSPGNDYTFTGSSTGTITVDVRRASSNTKAIYVKSVSVVYSSGGGETPSSYTVTYDANGGTGTMTDPNSPYAPSATVTTLDNIFTRSGYVFSNWNTRANGSGQSYDPGQTFTISANTTLYAQWTQTFTVTYDANGGTGTMTDPNSPYTSGSNVTVMSNSFTYTDYVFDHWNTAEDDSGQSYTPGQTINSISANTTLYAQWRLADLAGHTGTISFGTEPKTPINSSSCSGKDNLKQTWNITVTDNTGDNYTNQSSFSQIGVGSTNNAEKWASSVTFTTTLPNAYKVTAFSTSVGGFSGTAGSIALKVGDTQVGSGSFNGSNDVTVDAATTDSRGTVLTVLLTGGSSGRFRLKVYSITYTLAPELDTQIITASDESARCTETIVLETNADSATWSITANTADAHLSDNEGKYTEVSATHAGSVTVQAAADWYTTVTKTLTFVEGTYYDVTFDSDGGSFSPAKKVVAEDATFTFPSPGTKTHYHFLGWTVDGVDFYDEGDTSPAVTGDIEYLAWWEEDAKYTVTYVAGLNGGGTYAVANNYAGSYVLLPFNSLDGVSANTDYQFKDYTVGGVHKNPGDTIELNAATEVTVNFEEIRYVIVFGTDAGTTAITDFTNSSFVIPGGVTLNNIQGKVYCNTTNQAQALRLGSGDALGSFDATIDSEFYIKKVIVNIKYYNTDSTAKFAVTPNGGDSIEKTMTNSFANYEFDVSSAYTNKITLGNTTTGKRVFISGLTIVYGTKTAKALIENTINTKTMLSYRYEDNGAGGFTITDLSIRFGAVISKDLWNELDTSGHLISGFGVMIASLNTVHEYENLKDYAGMAVSSTSNDPAPNIASDVIDYYMPLTSRMPPEDGDDYAWNLFYRVDWEDREESFITAAYIKLGDDYVFFGQKHYSVISLALDYLANRGCNSSTAGGSLSWITTQTSME